MTDEITTKRVRKRNPQFLPEAEKMLADFKNGELESMIMFSRNKEGDIDIVYSYSETYEADAAALMAMGIMRMGFKAG